MFELSKSPHWPYQGFNSIQSWAIKQGELTFAINQRYKFHRSEQSTSLRFYIKSQDFKGDFTTFLKISGDQYTTGGIVGYNRPVSKWFARTCEVLIVNTFAPHIHWSRECCCFIVTCRIQIFNRRMLTMMTIVVEFAGLTLQLLPTSPTKESKALNILYQSFSSYLK